MHKSYKVTYCKQFVQKLLKYNTHYYHLFHVFYFLQDEGNTLFGREKKHGIDDGSDSDALDETLPPASALTRRRALVPPKLLTDGAPFEENYQDQVKSTLGYVSAFIYCTSCKIGVLFLFLLEGMSFCSYKNQICSSFSRKIMKS